MNKLIPISLVIVLFTSLFSCKQKAIDDTAEQQRLDSLRADSLRADSLHKIKVEEARIAKEIQDSIDWVNFTTPDLRLVGAHGHIKSIKEFSDGYEDQSFSFNEEGKILTYIDECFNFYRNSKGYIEIIEGTIGDAFGAVPNYRVKYNDDGKPSSLEYSDRNYFSNITLDDQGRYSVEEINDRTEPYKYTYKYVKTDEYGNWTKCIVTHYNKNDDLCFENSCSCEQVPFEELSKETRTRKITYYDR